jgi:hypothetical protein
MKGEHVRNIRFGLVVLATTCVSALAIFALAATGHVPDFAGPSASAAAPPQDSPPTLADIDQVSAAPSTADEFAVLVRTGQLKNPTESGGQLRIADGSVYAGTLMRRADGDAGYTCIRVLDGMACGQFSASSNVISGILEHPNSQLPPIAYGAVARDVSSVVVTCANGTSKGTIVGSQAFTAVLPPDVVVASCSVRAT